MEEIKEKRNTKRRDMSYRQGGEGEFRGRAGEVGLLARGK